jgi:hypothetical protein
MGFKYGQGLVKDVEDAVYAFRMEPHYDDHVGGKLMWHPGISVWRRMEDKAPNPEGLKIDLPAKQLPVFRMLLTVLVGAGAGYAVAGSVKGRA